MHVLIKAANISVILAPAVNEANLLRTALAAYDYPITDCMCGDYTLKIFGSEITISHRINLKMDESRYGSPMITAYELQVLAFYHDAKEAAHIYAVTCNDPNKIAGDILRDFFQSDCFMFNPQSVTF